MEKGRGKKREGGTNGRRGVREGRKISANTVKSNKNRKNEREIKRKREREKKKERDKGKIKREKEGK